MKLRKVNTIIVLEIVMLLIGTSVLLNINTVVSATSTITFFTEPPQGGAIRIGSWPGSIYYNGQSTELTEGEYLIIAEESSQYYFTHWTSTGGITIEDTYSQITYVVVSDSCTLTAWFEPFGDNLITLKLEPIDEGWITFNGTTYFFDEFGKTMGVDAGTYPITCETVMNHPFAYWTTTGSLTVTDPTSNYTTVTVSGPGSLTGWIIDPLPDCEPWDLDFGIHPPGWNGSQTFEIWNAGYGTLTYTFYENIPWVTIEPTSGNSTGEVDIITVSVINTEGMSGHYEDYFEIQYDYYYVPFNVSITIINPPEQPTGFSAITYNRTQINLTWTKGENATYTYIEWNSTASWLRGEGNFLYNQTGESYQHDTLIPGTTYYYQAWSWNATYNIWSDNVTDYATTIANNPPLFNNENPVNNSIDNELSFTWDIRIQDPEGDSFNWTINCSNGQSSSGTDETNGTKSLSLHGLSYSTTYTVWVNATDNYEAAIKCWYLFTTKSNMPPNLGVPCPSNESTGQPLNFTWNIPINDSEGDMFFWSIQCSNGQSNSGTDATNGTKTIALSDLAYSTIYKVWVNATDQDGSGEYARAWYTFTTQSNSPPDKPQRPAGETNGNINTIYSYTTSTTDQNGDQVYYLWDWGDGTQSSWLGPYDSGDVATAEHTWNTKGDYSIKVKAKDTSGAESDWSDPLPITMPYYYTHPILQILKELFERFPNAFPILRHLLGH